MKVKKKLLIHVCCGPCSTHPLMELLPDYQITGLFYNPNIYPETEYTVRLAETRSFFDAHNVPLLIGEYSHPAWREEVAHLADEPEGGERCRRCFHHRLRVTAQQASVLGFPIFTTTLTVGPNKPAAVIFPIARELAELHGIEFLSLDFKKQDGFKKSCQLSRQFGMYRQNYCGCEFSIPKSAHGHR